MNPLGILLITPPNFSIEQPYISIPMLQAFLKQNGIRNVEQCDANIDSFYFFTRKSFLRKCFNRIKANIKDVKEEIQESDGITREKYQYFCETVLYYYTVIRNINKSISYFRKLKKTDINEYNFHKNVIERAFDIVSAAHYPTLISHKNFSMRFSNQSFNDILKATTSDENPYLEYFEKVFLKEFAKKEYTVIGVSVTALSQIIPSFTLANLLKKLFPHTKIVFGGQVFNRLEDNIKQIPQFFKYVDYLILGEGETPLLNLAEYLLNKREITSVPNLLFYDNSKNMVIETSVKFREDIHKIPPPDYKGLKLSKYLSPIPVLSYQPARGCYWSKCTFCNQFAITGKGLRCKKPDEIVSDIKYLFKTFKTSYFSFVNESLPPKMMRDIAQKLLDEEFRIKWYAGARFDKGFDRNTLRLLKKSGCEKLYFGLESGSQKVLDKMGKGTDIEVIKQILKDTKEMGIGVHLFIMIGFTTETINDLELTKQFISEIIYYVDADNFSFYTSIYQLKPKTSVFENPSLFNIKRIFKKDDYDLEYLYRFEQTTMPLDNINYETEKKEIENMIDKITGQKQYPENIAHFLAFKNHLTRIDKGSQTANFQVNPYLIGKGVKYYNSRLYSYLFYDFLYDNLFEVENKRLWKFLLSLKRSFLIDEFKNSMENNFKIKNRVWLDEFTDTLIGDKILVRGGE